MEVWIFGMGGILGPSDFDLGKKVGSLDFCGGYSGTFGFGLREKVGSLDFWDGGVFWDLQIST